jgi:hypothetical protein
MNNRPYPLSVKNAIYRTALWALLAVLIAGMLAGCAAAPTPAPTETLPPPPPTETVAPPLTPTNTALPSDTPTTAPTATATSTETPTPTPVPLAVVQDGVTAWCVSFKDAEPMGGSPEPPAYARMGKVVKGVLNLNVSRGSCTFVFTFNQAVPTGAELQVRNATGGKYWTKAALNPVSGDPKRGFVTLTDQRLNDLNYWQVTYPFDLVASDGAILWKSDVLLYKISPGLCWEGSTPDPVTLFCPLSDTDFIPNYKTVTPVR